jgi:hypothetical protein
MKRPLLIKTKKTSAAKRPRKQYLGASDVEVNFKGPNTHKKYRKADEIYGDVSIPDSARKE